MTENAYAIHMIAECLFRLIGILEMTVKYFYFLTFLLLFSSDTIDISISGITLLSPLPCSFFVKDFPLNLLGSVYVSFISINSSEINFFYVHNFFFKGADSQNYGTPFFRRLCSKGVNRWG